jgi:hypothetical protein
MIHYAQLVLLIKIHPQVVLLRSLQQAVAQTPPELV